LWLASAGVLLLGALAIAVGVASAVAPARVIALVVGVAFVCIAWRSLAAGVAAFAIVIFLEQLPAVATQGVTFSKLGGAVLALMWLKNYLQDPGGAPQLWRERRAMAGAVLALLCWSLLSSVWAVDEAVAVSTTLRFAQGVLLTFIVFSAVQRRRHLIWIAYAFIAGAVLSAAVGLSGVTQSDRADILASGRLVGGIGDPNALAAALLPALGILLFLLAVPHNRRAQVLLLSGAAICAYAILATESRGGLVGLGVMLAAAILFGGRARTHVLAVFLALSGLAVAYFTVVAAPTALARVTAFSSGGGSGRTDLWNVGARVAENHPVVGVGIGNFQAVESRYAFGTFNLPRFDLVSNTPTVVHNMYLNVLAELGIVGLVLFVVVIAYALHAACAGVWAFERTNDLEMEMLGRGFVVGVIGLLASDIFLSAQYEKPLPFLLGAIAAIPTVARARRPA
jgi:O-antigen ligase